MTAKDCIATMADDNINDVEFMETQTERRGESIMIREMEEAINQIIPNANFIYPKEYMEYDGIICILDWSFPKGKTVITDAIEYLRRRFDVNNLVPFAIDTVDKDEKEPTEFACFLIDGDNSHKVITIRPFGPLESFYLKEYNDIDEWFNAERVASIIKEALTLNGRTKCIGLDIINEEACGPLIAIPKNLLNGCRLIMTTDAGVVYAENNDIKNVVESYGCGLRVISVREVENENVEVTMETLDGDSPGTICIEGVETKLPDDAYILATPFAGEFFVELETEDSEGNRTFLWGDDYIYK